ncbi:hypothetical protein N0V84_009401 [Fusarium piperis]|uniref:Uncharacterized protein n=1 Tax=Fusarium piperis TaxID=1435070 RepID=A0A9W8W6C2_9HYPO|nr:hypothetical protein N0V84_009401 [Fusarium piperis]
MRKGRAEVDKLRAECDAGIAEAMSKTQQAEASRDSLNQALTSQLKTKERQAAKAENRRVAIEQELNNVRGQLNARGQLIPGERDQLHIIHVQWGQSLPVRLGSVIDKCYTYHWQNRPIPVTVGFFNNQDSLRDVGRLGIATQETSNIMASKTIYF